MKKNIFILIDWYVPGYKAGGQIRSCSNMVLQLKKYLNFKILTRDTDLNSSQPYSGITSNEWTSIHNDVPIYYLSNNNINYKTIKKLILTENFDLLYLNSFFSFYFTIIPILLLKSYRKDKKIVLAVSGMLSSQALGIKPLKKKIFILLSKISGLYNNITFAASSEIEKNDIINIMGSKSIIEIAPNLAAPVTVEITKRTKNQNELKLIFLSRIHPIKNLDKVIAYLSKLDKVNKVMFDIYGPIENENYWNHCKKLISVLPPNIICSYKKELHHSKTDKIYKDYHFSILPSESENFGYSIAESITACCPVILSDNTPWRQLEEKYSGFDISLNDENKFVEALEKACLMSQDDYNIWLNGTYNFAKRIIDDKEKIEQNKSIFTSA